MKKITAAILISFCLISCQKEFKPKIPVYKPKLVINDLFEQNKPFKIVVSNSVDIYDTVNQPAYKNDAIVKLFVNNTLVETIANTGGLGVYNAGTVPTPGNTYKVIVSASGFNDAEVENTLPQVVKITDWTYIDSTFQKVDINGQQSWFGDLTFTINDPQEANMYLLSLSFFDPVSNAYVFIGNISSDDESLNQNLAKQLVNGEFLFKDNLFNGKTKKITIQVPSGLYQTTPNYLLSLYTLSNDAYIYLYSKPISGNTGQPNISPVYSNVKNGLGIFAGRSLDTDTIK